MRGVISGEREGEGGKEGERGNGGGRGEEKPLVTTILVVNTDDQ